MAERVIDLLSKTKFQDRLLPLCSTDSIRLAGAGLKTVADVKKYHEEIAHRVESLGLKGDHATYLVHLYGKQANEIIDYANKNQKADPEIDLALAELWFAIHHEMVAKATDFLVRRTGLLYFNIHRLYKIKEPVLRAMRQYLNWVSIRLSKEHEEVDELILQTLNFKHG